MFAVSLQYLILPAISLVYLVVRIALFVVMIIVTYFLFYLMVLILFYSDNYLFQ
jgi:hypothetical protein